MKMKWTSQSEIPHFGSYLSRLFLLVLALFLFTGCLLDRKDQANRRKAQNEEAIRQNAENLVQISTPILSLYMDKYEVSELAHGDYFSVRNQVPVTGVSKKEAEKICVERGGRLCTAFEWKNACLGIQGMRYSYGNEFTAKKCNISSEGPVQTAELEGCRSDTGLYDMVGNVMEWVSDEKSGRGIAMGGSYNSGSHTDCFTAFYFPAGFKSRQIGFRCCF